MLLQLALMLGFAGTIGLMMLVLTIAIVTGQKANRNEMKRLKREVKKLNDNGAQEPKRNDEERSDR